MRECESCGKVFQDSYFTSAGNVCDYCFAMKGMGYEEENTVSYYDLSFKSNSENKKGLLW